jgi:hypothetical protein
MAVNRAFAFAPIVDHSNFKTDMSEGKFYVSDGADWSPKLGEKYYWGCLSCREKKLRISRQAATEHSTHLAVKWDFPNAGRTCIKFLLVGLLGNSPCCSLIHPASDPMTDLVFKRYGEPTYSNFLFTRQGETQ